MKKIIAIATLGFAVTTSAMAADNIHNVSVGLGMRTLDGNDANVTAFEYSRADLDSSNEVGKLNYRWAASASFTNALHIGSTPPATVFPQLHQERSSMEEYSVGRMIETSFTETLHGSVRLGVGYGLLRHAGSDTEIRGFIADAIRLEKSFGTWRIGVEQAHVTGFTGAGSESTITASLRF